MNKTIPGILCLCMGALLGCYALFVMKTYVDTDMSVNSVSNLSLLNEKICLMIAACCLCICGILLVNADDKKSGLALAHMRAQTKLISLIASKYEHDADLLNSIIGETGDKEAMTFKGPEA